MNRDSVLEMIAEASKAPSVHNVQPARWRVAENRLILFEDLTVRLAVADPDGHDAAISLGCALEGLALAASKAGYDVVADECPLPDATHNLRPIASLRLEPGCTPDPLAEAVDKRQSWRGSFEKPGNADRETACGLEAKDCAVISKPAQLSELSNLVEDASFSFMRETPFRAELLSWMRLSRQDARWPVDGLNADAMRLGRMEALAAGFVLGPGFRLLDRVGLARLLLSEAAKTRSAAAVLVFHRPKDEAPLESGRNFYRLWLRIDAAGFGAAVLAALADNPEAARDVAGRAGIASDRRVVSAFRVGRRRNDTGYTRARLPLKDLLV